MKRGSVREVLLGLVLPLVLLAGLAIAGVNGERPAVLIAFMAVVPMLAAMLTRTIVTAIVAIATVGTAGLTAVATYGQSFSQAVPVLIAVIVASALAVLVSQFKATHTRPTTARLIGTRPVGDSALEREADEVTGLPTREQVMSVLAGQHQPGPHVVALIDIDHLDGTNSAHGRAVGDVFLFAVGGRARYALAAADTVARWDDDQFLLVIAGAMEAARPVLILIADKVNANPIRTDAGTLPASVSVGAASWAEGADFDAACAEALGALSSAKGRGGGCLVIADGSTG